MNKFTQQLNKVKKASRALGLSTSVQRNRILDDIAKHIEANKSRILKANAKDVAAFKGDPNMRDRLALTETRIKDIIKGIKIVRNLPDLLGTTLLHRKMPNGLKITKSAVPLGVVGVIYEARPNVTVDLAVLGLKSGNAVVLKGGKESWQTNKVLVELMQQSLKRNGFSADSLYIVDPKTDWKTDLMNAHGLVDVLIPRGGQNLIKFIRENAHIPVIETGAGVCHILVDQKYDAKKAASILVNAKTQRPSVCNSLDTLVIHEKAAKQVLPELAKQLAKHKVQIFADSASYAILKANYQSSLLQKAKPSDYGHEFLSLKMAIKTVANFEQGLKFVQDHTSGHSEAILTDNKKNAQKFLNEVDAAVVLENASTRFTDGGEFGMGVEVGISTQKFHARGPMGLDALTSYKWKVVGSGQIRK